MLMMNILAGLGLLICIALAVHMALRPKQRHWLDARLRRAAWRLREAWLALRGWRRHGQIKKAAAAEAEAAIRRARSKAEGEWDGNVYRPRQFGKKSRDPRDLH